MSDQRNILWVDDEIDLLRPHIKLLQAKGYDVETVTNGEDAIALVGEQPFDLIFLDESMVGMGGIETLAEIKEIDSNLPVVMVTKNEAEQVMEEAIGRRISDYLTKPVNPTQILLVCKKFLDGKKIKADYVQQDYIREFNQLAMKLMSPMVCREWAELYARLAEWELEFDQHHNIGLEQTLGDQKRDANGEFGKFVEENYRDWLTMEKDDPERPTLSPDIVDRYVVPKLQEDDGPVFFFVVDCMRLDQWMAMEELLADDFTINRNYYFSILPTATTYARNAIFAGLFPSEIEKHYPDLWTGDGKDDDHSQNKYEKELLDKLLERRRVTLRSGVRYAKIIDTDFGRKIESEILDYAQSQMVAVVVNAVDMMAHSRSDYPILKEIAPDESAYRSLTKSWFTHSSLYGMLKTLASEVPNARIILTTDHGAVRCLRGSKALGDRETSTNLRYKYGRNVKVDEKHAFYVKDPAEFKLPRRGPAIEYVIAKEDYYFVYPTDYHYYLNHYRDSFQHGGISLEEMILPIAELKAR
ncbi:MAG: PglZ domain-containing protein [Chlorobi bacterium]|nr:PglZ domain-containing protein [Chlorobiota bacterium]